MTYRNSFGIVFELFLARMVFRNRYGRRDKDRFRYGYRYRCRFIWIQIVMKMLI